jgi:AcrR family transcriptional regulator
MNLRANSKDRADSQYASRRAAIVDLAAHLFATNGYAATGISDIGEAANLARSALYYYIGSKESLLEEIHDRVLDPLLAEADEIRVLNLSSSERLRQVSESLLRHIFNRKDHVWVFLHEYRSLTDERRERFRRKRARFEEIVSELLKEGVANGEFSISDLRLTLMAFLGMHNYTYQWIRSSQDLNPKRLSKIYCDILFQGIKR